jgi:hypothetical protein
MSLCRHYVRELRRSVLVSTPELGLERERGTPSPYDFPDDGDEKSNSQRLSAFLRAETPDPNVSVSAPRRSMGDNLETPGRPSFMSTSPMDPTNSSSLSHTVNRADVRASAEKILYTYLLRGAEREIVLPDPILQSISQAIEVDGRDDPDVFNEAKDYVFQAMERDAFPGFLRSKALGNLVPASVMMRLIIGLLAMFGGFWAAFALIFLDITPRSTRLWVNKFWKPSASFWVQADFFFVAHIAVPNRRILLDSASILTGSHNGFDRDKRIHVHGVLCDQRAICTRPLGEAVPLDTSVDNRNWYNPWHSVFVVFVVLTSCSCGVGMPLYVRPWQKTIVVVSASSSRRNSDGFCIHSHSSIRSHWRFQQVFLAGV